MQGVQRQGKEEENQGLGWGINTKRQSQHKSHPQFYTESLCVPSIESRIKTLFSSSPQQLPKVFVRSSRHDRERNQRDLAARGFPNTRLCTTLWGCAGLRVGGATGGTSGDMHLVWKLPVLGRFSLSSWSHTQGPLSFIKQGVCVCMHMHGHVPVDIINIKGVDGNNRHREAGT